MSDETSVVPGKGSPCSFYEHLGFEYTGEVEHGEKVLRLDLQEIKREVL